MKISYKYRGPIYLFLLLLVLPFLTIRYALGKSVSAWFDCHRLHTELRYAETAASAEKAQDTFAEDMLLDGRVISAIQPAASKVVISDYRPLVTQQSNDIEIHTAAMVLGGNYADILHIVRHIEQTVRTCRISSLRFSIVAPPGTKNRQLEATVYIEQAVQTKNR